MAVTRRYTDRVWPDFLDYFRQDFRRERHGWLRVLQYFGLYIPLLLALGVALVVYIDPLPPKRVFMATGQKGSSYHALSERFADYFGRHGVELVLLPTPGLEQGLQDVRAAGKRASAGFITAGAVAPGQTPDLVSLGSQKYSPVWLFYRGRDPDPRHPLADLLQRRMAVGGPGTTTRKVLEQMLGLHGTTLPSGPGVLPLAHEEAAERFERGEIDAVFVVDGIDAPTVQRLLRVPGRRIVEFGLLDAYARQMPQMEVVKVPRGGIDVAGDFPSQDLRLLASSVTLVVEKDTHPAIQWLFLRAAERISQDRTEFFSKPDYFPKYLDRSIALSPVGERYFDGGMPVLFKYLPLWLATVIDGAGAILLAIFGVGWPLFNKVLSWRSYPSDKWLYDYWQDLRDLDHDLALIETEADARTIIEALDEMLPEVLETWVDDSLIHRYYGLRRTIADVRAQAVQRLALLRETQQRASTAAPAVAADAMP